MKPKKIEVGYIYKTDGTTERILPKDGKKFTLEEWQAAVGGDVESLRSGIKGVKLMFANENGIMLDLPPNPHTWYVVNGKIYRLNGYSQSWRVLGNIFAIKKEEE